MSPERTEILVTAHGTVSSLDDLPTFLQGIRRGRPAPPEIVREVRRRYEAIGGSSPLLALTTAQARALSSAARLPARVAMRLWQPRIEDVVKQMVDDGVSRIVSVPIAPYSASIYDDAVRAAVQAVDAEGRVSVVSLGAWNLQPTLIDALGARALEAYSAVARDGARPALVWSAHSLPIRVIDAGDPYAREVEETARGAWNWLAGHGVTTPFRLSFQSQGMTRDAWLGPDVPATLHALRDEGITHVVMAPIGFVTDHVEILYDLDIEATQLARACGITLTRTRTLNAAPELIDALVSRMAGDGIKFRA